MEVVPEEHRQFDWYHPQRDPQRKYTVDCMINDMPKPFKPLFVYALPNDDRTKDATIALLQFERWNLPFRSLAVFEDQENIRNGLKEILKYGKTWILSPEDIKLLRGANGIQSTIRRQLLWESIGKH